MSIYSALVCADALGEQISSLSSLPDFINDTEEGRLLNIIDAQPWLNDLRRRMQHYGYRYDYKARSVSHDLYLGALPDWLAGYADRLHGEGLFRQRPDQVIVNEYQPGQGIAPHIDYVPCFDETIASFSLGSSCMMDFTRDGQKTSDQLCSNRRSSSTSSLKVAS